MFLNFLKRLTLFSKILLSLVVVSFISAIIISCFAIYSIKSNEYLLNTNTGSIIKQPGMYFRMPWSHIKFTNNITYSEIDVIVSDNSGTIYFAKIGIYSNYDLEWIKTNKQIPTTLMINQDIFTSYMNNSYSKFSLKELNADGRKLQFDIITAFINSTIKDKGIILQRIVIPYPLFKVEPKLSFTKDTSI